MNITEKEKWHYQNQIVLIILTISLQLILYFLPPSFPYPFFIKDPTFGSHLFFLVYPVIFLGGILSGVGLGWRYLPLIVICLAGTTLVLWILLGILISTNILFSRMTMNELFEPLREFLRITIKEETIPAVIWGTAGGICGSFFYRLLGQRIRVAHLRSKFLFYISAASIITIVIFGIASATLSKDSLVFAGAPMIFVGTIVGLIAPSKAIMLAGVSQTLLGLTIVSWLALSAQGEGGMIVVLVLLTAPILIGCGVVGAFYGIYLRNHFLAKT